jgi:hypothetical protein
MDTFSKILNGIQFGSPEHAAAANKDMEEYNSSVEKNQSTPGHKFKWERYAPGIYRSCCGHQVMSSGSGKNTFYADEHQNVFHTLTHAKTYAHDSHVNEFKGKPAKG